MQYKDIFDVLFNSLWFSLFHREKTNFHMNYVTYFLKDVMYLDTVDAFRRMPYNTLKIKL